MKARIIALLMTITLMVLGSVYANWNLTYVANATVATGQLSIDTSCGTPYISEYAEGSIDKIDDEDNCFNASIQNFYPGAEAVYTICLTNTSTLGIVLSDIDISAGSLLSDADMQYLLDEIEISIALENEHYQSIDEFLEVKKDDLIDIIDGNNQRVYKLKFTFDGDNSVELNELEDIDIEYQITLNYSQYIKVE